MTLTNKLNYITVAYMPTATEIGKTYQVKLTATLLLNNGLTSTDSSYIFSLIVID